MRRTVIIAEAGVNHNGSIDLAKRLIDAASDAGADYVKFQTFKTEKLVSKQAKQAHYQQQNMGDEGGGSQYDMLKKLELTEADHYLLIEHCKEKNLRFLSTAFDEESVDFLEKLQIDLFKIPSGEITNLSYLRKIAALKKPVIISTGMCSLAEIEIALNEFVKNGFSRDMITVLHCNTEYPTPMKDVNLSAMLTIREAFKVNIGYSDHTLGIEVPVAAVALGATVIEKHFTLDKTMNGPDHKASLDPHELKEMVKAIRNIELAMGNGIKEPSASEIKNREIARKSLHTAAALKKGAILSGIDLISKRPGDGISPMEIDALTGKKLKTDLPADHKLSYTDLES